MNHYELINFLNYQQRLAVTSLADNLLVLAGAGSGKTKVLVHRIAWLISVKKISPKSILAVTFTNKAAMEMRNRLEKLIKLNSSMWIGTFHGLAYRLLKIHYEDVNLPKNFQIIDSDDQLRLIKRIIKSLNLDEKIWSSKKAMLYINKKKDQIYSDKNLKNNNNFIESNLKKIYYNYQQEISKSGLVDFAELLLLAYKLWKYNPNILNNYRKKFGHILIDEFQDTNSIQYSWIHALASKKSKIMVVGDDDQSIYGWRGAQIGNINRFLKDFKNCEKIILEQNYRSTPYILISANKLISNNKTRMGKNLWTLQKKGDLINVYNALNELDEANFVVNKIKKWKYKKGGKLKDCAILYRSNNLSRVLEETFLKENIPYMIYGGQRFFERKEIKDSIAYLRLIFSRNDNSAFERIINTPPRGIGNRTISMIRKQSKDSKKNLWDTTTFLLEKKIFLKKVHSNLNKFIELINLLDKKTSSISLYSKLDKVIKKSGLWSMYEKEKKLKQGETRIENLKELINAAYQYDNINKENPNKLQDFLSYTVLESDENKNNIKQDSVKMMTIHASKGLEFLNIFIIGMEENIFPSKMSLNQKENIEEERRLAYVGLTRAMQKLTLCYAIKRRIYGKEISNIQSRFIKELPKKCIKKIHFLDLNKI